MKKRKNKKIVPWTQGDEDALIKNVRENVTNLKKAFAITAKEINRTPLACSAHWYANTSIKSGHCLFVTISGKHIAINRKNGKGNKSDASLFRKVLTLFGLKD